MGTKQRIQFIVNPISGTKNKSDLRSLIQANIDSDKFDWIYTETQYRGHAIELTEQAVKDNMDIVVACGGDGTVNEVAKSLVHTDTILGIIPNGSGNGFARHINMPINKAAAIKVINTAKPKHIDTCLVNDIFFLNVAGIGFDAVVAYKIENSRKRGLKMYVGAVTKELLKFKAENYTIQTDTQTIKGAYSVIAIANATRYGFNFTIAPGADLTDGLLDLVLIEDAPIYRTVAESWRLLNKSLDKSKYVKVLKSKEVKITLDKPYFYHIDGESRKFDTELHFKIVPLSLKVLFPQELS